MKLYPNNKLANFRVKLAKPIVLDAPYLVALEELIYPQLHRTFQVHQVYVDIVTFGENQTLVSARIWLELASDEPEDIIIEYINREVKKYGWILRRSERHAPHLEFAYTKDDKKDRKLVRLHPKLAYLLGFGDGTKDELLSSLVSTAPKPSLLSDHSQQMFVYADIVDHQRVGDSLVPLLRICVLQPSDQKLVSEKYIRPYYLPVCKSHIEEINIQVRNHAGQTFPFPTGSPLIVKLHFKPV
jgi:hypothetical protein